MSHTFQVSGSSVNVSLADQPSLTNGLLPTLGFYFRFFNAAEKIRLSDFKFKVNLKNQQGYIRLIKYLEFEYPEIELSPQSNTTTSSLLILDPYILSKIEEYRESGDVVFTIYGNLMGQSFSVQGVPKNEMITGISLEVKIPKSDWVEKLLPAFNYKKTFLVEIPKLTNNEKIISHLDSAWKQKHMGQYDKVLTDCRKALEEVRAYVKKEAGEIKRENKNSLPDWSLYFDSEKRGEIFNKLDEVIWNFTARGAHTGKSINLEDADLALMITHAMINNLLKKQ